MKKNKYWRRYREIQTQTCGRYGRRRDRSMSKLNGSAQFSDHPPCPSLSRQLANRRCFSLSALESTASDHELCPRLGSSRARAPRSAVPPQKIMCKQSAVPSSSDINVPMDVEKNLFIDIQKWSLNVGTVKREIFRTCATLLKCGQSRNSS